MGLWIFPWELLEEILLLKEPWSFQKWLKLPACCPDSTLHYPIYLLFFAFVAWHSSGFLCKALFKGFNKVLELHSMSERHI